MAQNNQQGKPRKYIIGFINFLDNELKLGAVTARNRVEAGKLYLTKGEEELPSDISEMSELKTFCFDCDCAIEVKALDDLV